MSTIPLDIESAATELSALRNQRATIDARIKSILSLFPEGTDLRPEWHCERCEHTWRGQDPLRPPRGCPNCGSTGWRFASSRPNARRPGDPPNPKWRKNRRTGKPRVPLTRVSQRERIASLMPPWRRKREQVEAPPTLGTSLSPPPRLADVAPSLVAPPRMRFNEEILPGAHLSDVRNWPKDDEFIKDVVREGQLEVYQLEAIDTDGSILEEAE